MTVVFELPARRDVIAVGYSPLAEACFSLRVLVNPSRFRAHSGWVRTCRHALPSDLQSELRELAPLFVHSVPGFLTATTPASSSFTRELQRVAATDHHAASSEALSVLAKATPVDDPNELRRHWQTQPQHALRRLVDVLDEYWKVAFRSEWSRLAPLVRAEVTAMAARLRYGGEFATSPGIRLDRDKLTVRRACDRFEHVAVDGKQITVSPSSFLWPRVSVESSPPWPFAVFYPLPRAVSNGDDADLLPSLRALADGTRLEIVRLIAERPRSTQELAELVRLSDAAVSQHLRQLHAAGLATTRRDGHYVLYSIDARAMRRVARRLTSLGPP